MRSQLMYNGIAWVKQATLRSAGRRVLYCCAWPTFAWLISSSFIGLIVILCSLLIWIMRVLFIQSSIDAILLHEHSLCILTVIEHHLRPCASPTCPGCTAGWLALCEQVAQSHPTRVVRHGQHACAASSAWGPTAWSTVHGLLGYKGSSY